jgi:hypothetical protein
VEGGQVSEHLTARQRWSATIITRHVDVCESIVRGLPVLAGNLDPVVLRYALRGAELPPANTYITVTADMLDAVDEAGPYRLKTRRERR